MLRIKKQPTVKDLYELAVKMGIKTDPRKKLVLDRTLKSAKENLSKCKTKLEKESFDKDTTWNPYSDTRVLAGDLKAKVKKIAFGIDIETPELLLIQKLNESGAKIDMVISHHPEDKGLLGLGEVMRLQTDVYANVGVPINVAEKLMSPRITDINDSIHSINYNRASRAAELLKINFACMHTPCDNNVFHFLNKKFEGKNDLLLSDVIKILQEIPEFEEATRLSNPPIIACGTPKNRAGKVVVTEFTGGTSGSKKMYEKIANAGVGTVLTMHIGKAYKEEAEKFGINIINCGHMASDSIGINLVLDEFEKLGVEIVPLSGLIRYSRNKKKFVK